MLITKNYSICLMVEGIMGFSDMLSIAQTIGIVGTMVLTLFFSRKQLQSLSIHDQTRVLNDLDSKVRFAGVCDESGETKYGGFREGINHLLSPFASLLFVLDICCVLQILLYRTHLVIAFVILIPPVTMALEQEGSKN